MAVSSISGGQALSGFVTQQLRTQQAERAAEQAEANAQALRRQASAAQQAADRAQADARNLKVRSDQAQSEAGSARQAVVSLESLGELEQGFDALRQGIADGLAALTEVAVAAAPVVNAEGQTTGTLINVTA